MDIDYDLKSRVLELGLDDLQRQVSKSIYYYHYPNENVECELSYELAIHYDNFYSTKHPQLWDEAKKINHARYKRVRRLKYYISHLLNFGKCLFLTFTFSDKTFSKTSSQTRKAYVQRFLKSYDTLYVANIDFGEQKGREHFHSVILIDKVDFSNWSYGNLDVERIRSNNDFGAISQYIGKLTNHAIKETTKRSSIIYSRMTFADYEKKEKIAQFKNINFDEIENAVLSFEDEYKQDCLFD